MGRLCWYRVGLRVRLSWGPAAVEPEFARRIVAADLPVSFGALRAGSGKPGSVGRERIPGIDD